MKHFKTLFLTDIVMLLCVAYLFAQAPDTLWTKTYGGVSNENGTSLQQTSDGGYIIAGRTESYGAGSNDVYLIKTDLNGDTLWTKTYGGVNTEWGNSVQQTSDGGYIIAGMTDSYGAGINDVYLIKTDLNGDTLWTRTYGGTGIDAGHSVQQTMDGGYSVVGVTTSYSEIYGNLYFIRLTPDSLLTDDPSSLAYNGNRHLVRKPNSEILHIVYTIEGHVIYTRSPDGGTSWNALKNLGQGEFPAVCLDADGNPCVTWTNGDTLFFSRKDPVQGWQRTNYLFWELQLSHPSITVTLSDVDPLPDTAHILVRLFDNFYSYNAIREVSFPVTNPQSYQTRMIDASSGMNMVTLDFPSVARDYNNMLHATWMHGDTVYYGTREEEQSRWNVWEEPFHYWGRNSAHPFVETYGDSIFVVWQNEENEEVYRGRRHLQWLYFFWSNLSQTPATPSIYPVNASGMVTTFVDKASVHYENDIFWRISPEDPLHNLSNSGDTKSIFPHTSLQITQEPPIQYTVWQEGNEVPYEIKFEKTTGGRESSYISAYFNSIAGFETPSLYLVERDTFISDWQILVDVGYETITYQFPLKPDYQYKLQAVAYHEKENKWKMKVMIDGEDMTEIEYDPYKPETLELWISPAFYTDSLIEVTFECDDGDFAAIGPIYIYRYENSEVGGKGGRSGGPMTQGTFNRNRFSLTIFPNPFIQTLRIRFQTKADARFSIKVYDVTGRLVKNIYKGMIDGRRTVNWHGDNENSRSVSQGIYFLRLKNLETDETFSRKLIKLQ